MKKVIWIIGSGCSRYMTDDKALLSQFEKKVGPLVTFGDNIKGFTMGYSKIVSRNIVIDDVALVAGLEVNLYSVSQFVDKGTRKGSLFVADLDSTNKDGIYCFYNRASEEQSKLWHKKLSHMNFKAINTLVKKELVRDMPNLEFAQVEVCEACQKGKMKRSSHKSQVKNCELYKCTIAAYSQFIHFKDETPHIIIEHIIKIEKQAEDHNCVKRFRSDNGTEFKNAIMSEFCKSKGIVQEFSVARTPQQNGAVEIKNRTLVEASRTMVQDTKLPISFWEEAFNTACYTQNRYLINKAHGKSPYPIMFKRKPTIKHLHVFGNKCYILKDNSEYVEKFDSKVFEAIFLGYSLERTSYKVYVIDQKKIMENTDVTFDDEKCPGLE
ncbi:hypothetical protein AgCh_034612 [Apium graveolens]